MPGFFGDPVLPKEKSSEPKEEEKKSEKEEEKTAKKEESKAEVDQETQWDEDLVKAWYRLGVFMPFFRAHAMIESKRREPWEFSAEALAHIRSSINLRYRLLTYLYTQFYIFRTPSEGNLPILRPLWFNRDAQFDDHTESHTFQFGPAVVVSVNEPDKALT